MRQKIIGAKHAPVRRPYVHSPYSHGEGRRLLRESELPGARRHTHRRPGCQPTGTVRRVRPGIGPATGYARFTNMRCRRNGETENPLRRLLIPQLRYVVDREYGCR